MWKYFSPSRETIQRVRETSLDVVDLLFYATDDISFDDTVLSTTEPLSAKRLPFYTLAITY